MLKTMLKTVLNFIDVMEFIKLLACNCDVINYSKS